MTVEEWLTIGLQWFTVEELAPYWAKAKMAEKKQEQCRSAHPSFRATKTCDECPWRKDVPTGRFPPERFIKLRRTVEQGFGPIFACHKSHEGTDVACVGYLLRCGENNWMVRMAASERAFDPMKLEATGPLYDDFEEMARANGVRKRNKKPGGT